MSNDRCGYCNGTNTMLNGDGCPDCITVAKKEGYFVGEVECPFCHGTGLGDKSVREFLKSKKESKS